MDVSFSTSNIIIIIIIYVILCYVLVIFWIVWMFSIIFRIKLYEGEKVPTSQQ